MNDENSSFCGAISGGDIPMLSVILKEVGMFICSSEAMMSMTTVVIQQLSSEQSLKMDMFKAKAEAFAFLMLIVICYTQPSSGFNLDDASFYRALFCVKLSERTNFRNNGIKA